MEVTVVETGDLPANTVISFHTGSIRRHAHVEKDKAINLSYVTGSEPIRVDLMSQIGSHTFDMIPGQDVYDVPINSADTSGNDVKLKFQIRDAAAAADARAKKADEKEGQSASADENGGFDSQSPVSPSRKLQTALMMRSYLDNHDVLRQMQELLQDMVTNRPEDPIDYMIKRLEVVCEDSQDVEIECLDGSSSRIIMADVDVKVFGMPASASSMGPVLLAMDAGVGGLEMCNLMEGAHMKPEFLAMNPFHHIPTLRDGDFAIGESGANLRYIAIKYKPSYYPVNDPVTCGWIDFAIDSFASDVYPALANIIYPVLGFKGYPDDQLKANKDLQEILDTWLKHFLKSKFVCGDRISMPDFKAVPFLFALAQPGVEKKTGFKCPSRVRQYVEDFCIATKSSAMLKSAGGFSLAEVIASNVPDAGTMSSFTKTSLAAPASLGRPSGKVIIYGMPASANSMSAALLAMDVGVGALEICDLSKGQHMTPDFLAMNPFHHIPTLKDGGFVMAESNAMLRYIAMNYKPAYYPLHDQQVCSMIDFAVESFSCDVYPKWSKVVYPVMGFAAAPDDKKQASEDLTAILDTWMQKFLKSTFVCDKLTIADFKIAPYLFACCQPGIETQASFKASDRIKRYCEDFCAASSSTSMLKSAGGYSIAEVIAMKAGSPVTPATESKRNASKEKSKRNASKEKSKTEEDSEEEDDDDDVEDLPPPPPPTQVQKKRQSVSAEAYGAYNQRQAFQKKVVPKDDTQKARIREVLSLSWMFKSLNAEAISAIVDAMTEKVVEKDIRIVSQGEDGNVMWVIEEGVLECSKVLGPDEEKVVKVCKRGDVFGELALLYSVPRAASVTSRAKCLLWELDRDTFKAVCNNDAMQNVSYDGFSAPTSAQPQPQPQPQQQQQQQQQQDDSDEEEAADDRPPVTKKPTGRRPGVSAETAKDDGDYVPPVHPKSAEERKQLSDIIKTSHDGKLHMLFGTVTAPTFEKILDATFLKVYQPGDHAIEQGDVGDFFYIVKSGKFDIIVKKGEDPAKKVFEAEQGFAFGELALLYNAPRSATITATVESEVWCLDRTAFQHLVVRSAKAQFQEYVNFLGGVDAFQVLSDNERASLAEVLEEEEFDEDEAIVEQGERDDKMFILRTGNAVACIKGDKGEVEVKQYSVGDYFGEIALLSGEPRKASVYAVGPVTCLYITRETFLRILGPLQHLLERNMSSYSKYQDAIANAEPDSTERRPSKDPQNDDDEFHGGVNLQGKTKTKIAKKRERKVEDLSGITVTGKKIEKDEIEPASLADKVAQDFKNKALVEPSDAFKLSESEFWIYGGLMLGQKFTMDKLLHVIPGPVAVKADEDETYTWDSPSKLKGATELAVLCQKGQKSAADPTPNQDNYFIQHVGPVSMYGVCDGHGPFGHLVSFRLVQTLPYYLTNSTHFGKDWEAALKEAFGEAQRDLVEFCGAHNINIEASGAAGSVLVMEEQTIHIAFIGDARIMLGSWNRRDSRLIFVTSDHKPENPGEKERLQAAGSEVREIDGGSHRIYLPGSNFPGLTMSRAFGDTACNGVLREPEYHKYLMQPSDEWFAIVASDGIWEFIEGEECLNMTAKKLRLKGARETLQFLVAASRKRWQYCCGEYCDDITAILVQWNSHEKKSGKANHTLTVRKPAS